MKKILLFILLSIPTLGTAQRLPVHGYIGGIYHDDEFGGSAVASFSINKHLSAGVGADITKYLDKTFIPIYVDVRGGMPFNKWTPYAVAQGGTMAYQNDGYIEKGERFGLPYQAAVDIQGRYFFGGGLGIKYDLGPVGVFAQYALRNYYFNYDYSGENYDDTKSKTIGILTAGIIF